MYISFPVRSQFTIFIIINSNNQMLNKLLQIIDGDDEESSIFGLLRLIRFDIDPNQKRRPFQKHVATSHSVEDAKGNPGSIGDFFLSNLRFIWQMRNDNYVNLTCGLQSIVFVQIKTVPVQWGSGYKHSLTVKAQNQSQTRYEFKFVSYNQNDLKLFEKLNSIRKQVMNTKSYRCTNLAIKFENQYEPMEGEQVKGQYSNLIFVEDQRRCGCRIFLTNVRLVLIKENEKKMNIGIVWLMIKSIQPEEDGDLKGVRLICRGLLAMKQMYLFGSKLQEMKKLQYELKSFCQLYNKAPILGFNVEQQPQAQKKQQAKVTEIEELQGTKINLVRRKNAYTSSSGVGKLQNTQFDAQLGLMIEKLPEGVVRSDLWQIIK